MAVLLVSFSGYINLGSSYVPSIIVNVKSPIQGATYQSNNVTVKVEGALDTDGISSEESFLTYCYLDGKLYAQTSYTEITTDPTTGNVIEITEINLIHLTQGKHEIKVDTEADWNRWINLGIYDTGKQIVNTVTISFFVDLTAITPTPKQTQTIAPPLTPTLQIIDNTFSNLVIILSGVIAGAVIVSIALLVIYRKHSLKLKVKGDGTEKET
jgi:hypothetical protein